MEWFVGLKIFSPGWKASKLTLNRFTGIGRRAAQTPVALDQECVNAPESVQRERDAGSDSTAPQLDLFPQANGPFADELKEMNLSQVTPLQALLKLNEWQEMLRDRR